MLKASSIGRVNSEPPITSMKASFFQKLALGLMFSACTVSSSYAALLASDNASDPAYNSGFTNGTNGGSGFGAWQFANTTGTTNTAFAGEFIGDSSTNGSGTSGNINSAGNKSWGLYSNTNNLADATRPFTGQLLTNEAFSLKMDNGFLNTSQSVGFGLQNSSGTNRLEFYFTGGASFYDINVPGTGVNSTNLTGNGTPFTADGLSIKFKQLASNGWTLDVTPNGGPLRTYSSTDFGALAASDISQVRLFDFNPGAGGGGVDAFFNTLQIVPEPGQLLIGILASGCFLFRRRRG